jgi:hypothetical protein
MAADLGARAKPRLERVEDDLRLRAEAASSELRRRADELRVEATRATRGAGHPVPWGDPDRELPSAGSLAYELAIGAARLAATLAKAPFRLAWAILRPRGA